MPAPETTERKQATPSRKVTFFLIILFLAMWMTGIAVDEPTMVLQQAWSICLGCIGIG